MVEDPRFVVPDVGQCHFVLPASNGEFQARLSLPEIPEVTRDLARAWRRVEGIGARTVLTLDSRQRSLRRFLGFLEEMGPLDNRSELRDVNAT